MILKIYQALSKAQRAHLVTAIMLILYITFPYIVTSHNCTSWMFYLSNVMPLILTLLGIFLLFPQNFLTKLRQFIVDLRLIPHFLPAVSLGLVACLPLLIITIIIGVRLPDNLIAYPINLLSGIISSIFLWAFLCDMNFKHTRLGFLPIVLSLGFAHCVSDILSLTNSLSETPLSSVIPQFSLYTLFTLFGNIITVLVTYWLYKEWRNNVWLPVMLTFFHFTARSVIDPTALINDTFWHSSYTIVSLLPYILAVIITYNFKRRRNIPFAITRENRGMKKG